MSAKRVLIIEDAADLSQMYLKFLSDLDCEISIAHSAHEALREFHKQVPDILITDLTFPDMPTLEYYEKLSELPQYKDVYKILVSGQDDLGMWQDLFNADIAIQKPVPKVELRKAVLSHE